MAIPSDHHDTPGHPMNIYVETTGGHTLHRNVTLEQDTHLNLYDNNTQELIAVYAHWTSWHDADHINDDGMAG